MELSCYEAIKNRWCLMETMKNDRDTRVDIYIIYGNWGFYQAQMETWPANGDLTNRNFRELKSEEQMEISWVMGRFQCHFNGNKTGSNRWRYVSTIFLAIFWGNIPWNFGLKNRPNIYGIGTSNQSVLFQWPLILSPLVSLRYSKHTILFHG